MRWSVRITYAAIAEARQMTDTTIVVTTIVQYSAATLEKPLVLPPTSCTTALIAMPDFSACVQHGAFLGMHIAKPTCQWQRLLWHWCVVRSSAQGS